MPGHFDQAQLGKAGDISLGAVVGLAGAQRIQNLFPVRLFPHRQVIDDDLPAQVPEP